VIKVLKSAYGKKIYSCGDKNLLRATVWGIILRTRRTLRLQEEVIYMLKRYIPANVEKKWQEKWKESGIYKTDLFKEKKYYVLAEYAYPSGDLHMGHWFTWSGADVFARFKRMQGFNVFFPNGFDSFGLPAEGAAIKRNIHPNDWTEANIERMKEQYQTMGPSFEFYGDLASHRANYFKWNQWIFLRMYEQGIAYKGKYLSNWCPVDQTVLANEAVEGGRCWRCGSEVVQKEIEQWFFKITDYADRLLWGNTDKEVSNGVRWPVSVRTAQNEWIGKKEGINITYDIKDSQEKVTVFTTRPDTNFGATFIVLAPEHPLTEKITTEDRKEAVSKYIKEAKKKSELERKENKQKTGEFTGAYAINQLTGYEMPVYVADYVLMGYGTGAVVGVPGHDLRDFEFAKAMELKIIRVVVGSDGDTSEIGRVDQVQEAEGTMINSGFLDGMDIHEATKKIMDYIEEKGWGKKTFTYHIHDWSVSRQRYWGTPVPVIHCPDCGIVPVPDEDLPVLLPYDVDFQPKGKPPLASNEEWLKVKCPKCGGGAEREAETLDTFVDSSWYFFRYLDPNLKSAPFDTELARLIMPVDIYFGGAEHTLGHTLYSRFFTKFFKDLSLTELEEYALRRVNHGIILGPDGTKMSKSRPESVVNPDEEVKKYGADTIRLYLAFLMPYESTGPWDRERVNGPYRFLQRIWALSHKVKDLSLTEADLRQMNQTIKAVSEDIEAIKFNTAVARLMEWLNYLSSKNEVSKEEYKNMLLLLAPFAPHITEELWEGIGEEFSIHLKKFPDHDEKYLDEPDVNIVVQVNGKVRDQFKMSKDSTKNDVMEKAKASEKVSKFLTGDIKKSIFIPGKLLNIVI
jgi:leucyl-tRNA synthetase